MATRSALVRSSSGARLLLSVGAAGALYTSAGARASISLVSASATITHASNFGSSPATRTGTATSGVNLSDYASVGAIVATYQLPNGALTSGTTQTTAKAGVATVTSSTQIGLAVVGGTTITQKNNANPSASTASSLTIAYTATWLVSGSFGPMSSAGASMSVLGSLPNNPPPGPNTPSASAFFQGGVTADFMQMVGGSGIILPIRSSISNSNFVYTNYQGAFSVSASDLATPTPTTFTDASTITLSGTLTYTIHNDTQEAQFNNQEPIFVGLDIRDVPTPGAATLAGLVGVAALRRRRR